MGSPSLRTFHWLRWTNWPLGAKSAAAVTLPLLLLAVALLFSYRLQQDIVAADADVRRALVIQAEIQTLHSLVAESAMSIRGYLLTGRDEFLAPYRRARSALPDALGTLRRNIRDPDMHRRLERIEHLLNRKLQSLEQLRVDGRSLDNMDLQAHLIGSKGILDDLRDEISGMHAREADLVGQYSDAARQALQRNLWMDAVTSVLTVITGAAAFIILFGSVVSRVKRLTVNAERLAQGQPLQALPSGHDELGVLAERLQNTSLLLAKRAEEARSASEAKSQFLSRTSHELRTPLNAILGFAQLLELDLQAPSQRAHLSQILSSGRHLLSLIDEVLDISRIESGELSLELQPLTLGPLAREIRELTAPLALQHRVNVHLDSRLDALAMKADRRRLRQILLNLVSNAIKYNREHGEVWLDAHALDDQVQLRVRDTGRGIPVQRLPRLFTPFDRLDMDDSTVPGTGLGLTVSRQLALCMGGDIEVESVPDLGSVFSLRLPAATPTADAGPATAADRSGNAGTQDRAMRCVLVIEDNPSNLALLQALVARRSGWRMATARSGPEGIHQSLQIRPDLILLDLHLPGLGGEAVLQSLRHAPELAHSRIVIISADAQPGTQARLLDAGAHGYLTKPLVVSKVFDLLDGIAHG